MAFDSTDDGVVLKSVTLGKVPDDDLITIDVENGGGNVEKDSRNVAENVEKVGMLSKCLKWSEQWKVPNWAYCCITSVLIPVIIWAVCYLLMGDLALPGGPVFAILIIEFFGIALGQMVSKIQLPPLLGMLTLGILIRNVPTIDFGTALTPEISSPLRQLALVIILIRAGLGLDPAALMRLKGVVIRLAFCPCVAEAVTIAITSHFILGFPWLWGFLLGFVLAAVSPAVVVPCLLSLKERGLGVAKGIPTIVIAAASVDDILAISAFGLVLGFTFSRGESLAALILQGPLEVLLGIGFGIGWGSVLGIFVTKTEEEDSNSVIIRVLLILGGGCLAVFGFQHIGFPGSGALGCLTATFVTAVFWRGRGILEDNDNLSWVFSMLWFVFEPLLFGLIGCEIDAKNIDLQVVGLGVVCLIIGLAVRLAVSYLSVLNSGLNVKERIFVAIAWVPKATVQAAIGPIALDTARKMNEGKARDASEELGLQLLTIAVLVILITAPIGAAAVMLFGPKLLSTSKDLKNYKDGSTGDYESSEAVLKPQEDTNLISENGEPGIAIAINGDQKDAQE